MSKYLQISVKLPSGERLIGQSIDHTDELEAEVKDFIQQSLVRGGFTLYHDDGMFLIPEGLLQRSYITVLISERNDNVGS